MVGSIDSLLKCSIVQGDSRIMLPGANPQALVAL